MATKDLGDGVPVKALLGPVGGNLVAICVSSNQLLPPLGVLSSQGLLQVQLLPDVRCIRLQVHLQGRVQHVQLGEDASQVANHRANVCLELVVILKELLKLRSLVDLKEALLGLPLAPPVEEVGPKVCPLV